MANPEVSVVIVTYGTGEIVLETLAALVEHTEVPFEVIVVDNPPDDLARASRHLLRQYTRGITLVTPATNLGFGGGCDAGVALARAELLCLMNPDLVVTAGWYAPLRAALDDPAVAVAAPVLRHPDGMLQEAGQVIYDDGFTGAIGGPRLFTGDEAQVFPRDVDYASAACWLLRRAEHLERGGFDRRYHPAYFEDADYGLRVRQEGRVTRLVAEVPVIHHHGQGGETPVTAQVQASHLLLRDIWADVLATQPPPPESDLEAIINRDHAAQRRIVYRIESSRLSEEERQAMFVSAEQRARTEPRHRVTVITDHGSGWDLDEARRAGLEVVIGNVAGLAAARGATIEEWVDTPTKMPPARATASTPVTAAGRRRRRWLGRNHVAG
jgi:GT2 family glycosyltransferase